MIGIVADDLTGANDIGSVFAKAELRTYVFVFDGGDPPNLGEVEADVLILDTDSRFDPADQAYTKVHAATRFLRGVGCNRFYKKTCSVFRGNVGAELDAMLDALEEPFAIVVAGYPKNGRTTVGSIHYVHGQRLDESPFRHDPVHPMRTANLVELLAKQTRRGVSAVKLEDVRGGVDKLRKQVEERRSTPGYVILDVVEQADLTTIATATLDRRVYAGSSGLAEELAVLWRDQSRDAQADDIPARTAGVGVLAVAGSLMPQSAAQIAYARSRGRLVYEIDPLCVFAAQTQAAEVEAAAARIGEQLLGDNDVVVCVSDDANLVAQTKALGAAHGMDASATGRLVSDTMGRIVASVAGRTRTNRLFISGGDTASAVCRHLSVRGMRVWQELAPGVPSCLALVEPPMVLVLKPGSYGRVEFVAEALEYLRDC